ncbi:MAG TPA: cytochrome c nitrite reductase small subunit [Desulfobulbaceae bacterium]|nr:cytochrome c nitrite reductase small subunit [Desulfobulbaceae bacterium]
MKKSNFVTIATTVAAVVAVGMFFYLAHISRATSYLSDNPKNCINCHVMNSQYATWQHSAHARVAKCVDCHLPAGHGLATYTAKALDGLRHAWAFTLNEFGQRIVISENGKKRVQDNCIRCHSTIAATLISNRDRFHDFTNSQVNTDSYCWNCHRDTPHGQVRNLASTPYNLDVRELK